VGHKQQNIQDKPTSKDMQNQEKKSPPGSQQELLSFPPPLLEFLAHYQHRNKEALLFLVRIVPLNHPTCNRPHPSQSQFILLLPFLAILFIKHCHQDALIGLQVRVGYSHLQQLVQRKVAVLGHLHRH
jgi:hypothetical protein